VRTLGDRMIALGRLAAIFVMAGLGGCASVISGTSQTLTLDTVPSGADCSLSRKGLVIGRVNPTPGAVYVQRTHDDITVTCTKDGYKTGSFLNKSGLEAATLGNIILGGLIGVAVDAASGANNKYDEKVRIVLAPTDETLRATSPPDGALAPTADFRCPAAGTVIRNSTGGQLTFTEANDSRCGYTDETGQKHERYAIFADGYGRLARKEMDGLWPLKVGNIVSFHIHDSSSVQTSDRYFVRDLDETFAVGRQEGADHGASGNLRHLRRRLDRARDRTQSNGRINHPLVCAECRLRRQVVGAHAQQQRGQLRQRRALCRHDL
jgi:hypothetical protein